MTTHAWTKTEWHKITLNDHPPWTKMEQYMMGLKIPVLNKDEPVPDNPGRLSILNKDESVPDDPGQLPV